MGNNKNDILQGYSKQEKIEIVKDFLDIRKHGFEGDFLAYLEYLEQYSDDNHYLRNKYKVVESNINDDDIPF